MKKRIERKEERIEAIRAAATRCRGVYSAVAREQGWGRAYVCSVMAGRNSSENVLKALEEKYRCNFCPAIVIYYNKVWPFRGSRRVRSG